MIYSVFDNLLTSNVIPLTSLRARRWLHALDFEAESRIYWMTHTGGFDSGGTSAGFPFFTTDTGSKKPPGTFVPFYGTRCQH